MLLITRLIDCREVSIFSPSFAHVTSQPKSIKDIKTFLEYTRRPDCKGRCQYRSQSSERLINASAVRIKKNGSATKFKVRTSKYLYTITVADKAKADKLKQSLNPSTFTLLF